jgi:tetratricopeptide (TPR) repeat protein
MTPVWTMVLAAILLAEPPTQPDADERQRAKEAFDKGLAAVADGEFQTAVDSFEQAYSLRPHPVTLFNLALALEKADRLPEAWEVFETVIDLVESDAERREVRRHMRAIATKIAILEVHATPRVRLCLDGGDMPRDEDDRNRLALHPGEHALLLDDHELRVDLEPGDQRVLLLEDSHLWIEGRRRSPLMPAMIGTAIGTGSLALGLGIGAATADDPRARTGLAASAATSAGLAVAASVVALLIETRVLREPKRKGEPVTPDCPGSEQLEQRIDLRLAPTIRRPAEFSRLELVPRMPIPTADPAYPQLASIAPRRSEARPHVGGN